MEKQILRDIYLKYGNDAIFNQKKLRAYLLDMRIPKKTVNLLTDISRTEYFKRFAKEIETDTTARERLIYNTESEHAFEKRAVEFGVDCWVFAFTGGANTGGGASPSSDDDIWPAEKAELVAAALRELMRDE